MKALIKSIVKKKFRINDEVVENKNVIVPLNNPVMYGELLKNKTAFITGGSSGIGYAIADAFLRNGANVIITGRDKKRLDEACEKLSESYNNLNVFGVLLDNRDINNMEKVFHECLCLLKDIKIDVFVNNAGVGSKTGFGSADETDWDAVIDTNLKGPYFLTQIFSKYLIDNKICGNILFVASSSSLRPATTSYEISKWGIRGFVMGMAKKLSFHNIVVNGIAPGPTATRMLLSEGETDISRPKSPSGRYATAEEIANLAVILVSDIGKMINGDIIYATGGCGNLTLDDYSYN